MKTYTLLTATPEAFETAGAQEVVVDQDGQNLNQVLAEVNPKPVVEGQLEEKPQGGGWQIWIMLLLVFVVMWFFMIRPQRKQQKEMQKFRDGLKKGDKVVTIGGIYGTVYEIKENYILIEVDNNVKMRVSKQALVKDFSEQQ